MTEPLTPRPGLCPLLHPSCQRQGLQELGLRAQSSGMWLPSGLAKPFTIQPHLQPHPLWRSACPTHSCLHTSHPLQWLSLLSAWNCLPSLFQLIKSYSIPRVSSSNVTSSGIAPNPKQISYPFPCVLGHSLHLLGTLFVTFFKDMCNIYLF